eukprot:364756-Prymnesium_polylepis.1
MHSGNGRRVALEYRLPAHHRPKAIAGTGDKKQSNKQKNRPGGTSDANTRGRRTRDRGTNTDANAEGRRYQAASASPLVAPHPAGRCPSACLPRSIVDRRVRIRHHARQDDVHCAACSTVSFGH